jgi:hypothetical protein
MTEAIREGNTSYRIGFLEEFEKEYWKKFYQKYENMIMDGSPACMLPIVIPEPDPRNIPMGRCRVFIKNPQMIFIKDEFA